MADYIPADDAGRVEWLLNFASWLTTNGVNHGLTPNEITQFNGLSNSAAASVANSATQQALARAAVAGKKTELGKAAAMARDLAQRVQHHSTTTDADRAAAGITVHDANKTPTSTEKILTIHAPLIDLDHGVRRQVTVHWGPNPTNEHQNARPSGVIGCEIQVAKGGIPTDEALWTILETDTESPFIHIIHETTPATFAYRARYVSKNLKHGPFSDPVVCTVST